MSASATFDPEGFKRTTAEQWQRAAGARVLCRGHAFPRNLRGGSRELGQPIDTTVFTRRPPVERARAALTAAFPGR